ncbi:MAG: hypothetical protein ACKO3P_03970 [Planctomycetaceae bacterium]
MNRLFLANLSCEADWARAWQRKRGVGFLPHGSRDSGGAGGGSAHTAGTALRPGLPAGLQRAVQQEAMLQSVWQGMMNPGDRVLDWRAWRDRAGLRKAGRDRGVTLADAGHERGETPEGESWGSAESARVLIPWGATEEAFRQAEQLGCVWGGADPELAMRFNQRSERFQIESELDWTLPGSRLIHSSEELRQAVAGGYTVGQGWILKANFGMAGREAIRGRGPSLTIPQIGFCESRSAQTGPLVLEPMLAPVEEVGVLWEISAGGVPELQGVARQWVVGGAWRGCLFFHPDHQPPHWAEAVASTSRVAEKLAGWGYRGPLGIDAMWHRDAEGKVALRPLQDLNARWTMGRMGLAWHKRLESPSAGAWILSDPVIGGGDLSGELEVARWLGPNWRLHKRVATGATDAGEATSEQGEGPSFLVFESVQT